MNQREEIINKINELQNMISDSKEDATASELSEYLVKINKLQVLLQIIVEENNKNKEEECS